MASRATAPDFSGSATIFVIMKWHLPHSNIRFSKPSLRRSDLARGIRVPHREQRGCSMAASGVLVGLKNEAMTLTYDQGESFLPGTDDCLRAAR